MLQGQGKSKTKDAQVTAESQLLSSEAFPVYSKKCLPNAPKVGSVGIKKWANLIRLLFPKHFLFFCCTSKIISEAALKGFHQFSPKMAKERD